LGRLVAGVALHLSQSTARAADPLLMKNQLQEWGQLGPEAEEYLRKLKATPTPELDRVIAYVDILKERASKEQLLQLSNGIGAYLKNPSAQKPPVADFAADLFRELLEIQNQRQSRRLKPATVMARQIMAEAEQRPKGSKALLGYSVAPFHRLNETLSGLRRGFYYGVAGAPRRGKTNFALHLAAHLIANQSIPALFISWEQTRKVLTARLLARELNVNPAALLTQDLSSMLPNPELLAKGVKGIERYGRQFFLLEGTRQHTLDRIRAMAYNLMHEFRTDGVAIFLDYLQKIPLPDRPGDVRMRIDDISTGLADLSLELNCPVVAISALDKDGCRLDDEPNWDASYEELLKRPRPTMHNCTGGGDIEYDLDAALILAKDWLTSRELAELLRTRFGAKAPAVDVVNLYIDKNRDSASEAAQVIQYAFLIHENRFVELGYKTEEEYKAEFHGFAKVQEMCAFLIETGFLKSPS
jgi:replicative DNA helicase